MANILPPFPPFSVHEDDASVGPRWKKWLKRFEMYLAAHEVKDPTRKSPTFSKHFQTRAKKKNTTKP